MAVLVTAIQSPVRLVRSPRIGCPQRVRAWREGVEPFGRSRRPIGTGDRHSGAGAEQKQGTG